MLFLINDAIIKEKWEDAKKCGTELEAIVVNEFLMRKGNVKEIYEKSDSLIRLFGKPFGNFPKLKRGVCLKEFKKLIDWIGEQGISIGQRKVKYPSHSVALREIMSDLPKLMPFIDQADIRDEIVEKLEYLKREVLPNLNCPQLLYARMIESVNNAQGNVPTRRETPASMKKAFIDAMTELQTMADFYQMIRRNPKMKEFILKRLKESQFDIATIRKITEGIAKKAIAEELEAVGE